MACFFLFLLVYMANDLCGYLTDGIMKQTDTVEGKV